MTLRVVGIHWSSSELLYHHESTSDRCNDDDDFVMLLFSKNERSKPKHTMIKFYYRSAFVRLMTRECGRAALLCCRFPEYKKNNERVVFFVQDLEFATTHHSSRWCHRARSLCSRLRRHSETRGVSKSLTFRPLTQKNNSYVVFYVPFKVVTGKLVNFCQFI